MSTAGVVQYCGGYHPLKFEYRGGYHDTCGRYHEYRGVGIRDVAFFQDTSFSTGKEIFGSIL